MSVGILKPPWLQIQWHTVSARITQEDLSGSLVEGEWKEDVHTEIEMLKESIQPYDRTELWDIAKRITNPYELISTHSSRLRLPKSTCCIHPLSRSYFKMVEILTHLQFFDRHKDPKLKSLHICEGPGGFIEAFHSMAETKKKIIQSSHAMTLKSTHQMIPGWRRATQFLQKHPAVHIVYGPTKTGNIYEPINQDECVNIVGNSGAHLVTADGGFDFSDDFQNQEKTILRLLVSSALILLRTVAIEGDIVLKLFDCNSRVTRDLIYLMASCFSSWTLYKPVTSRPCNSESYFIGRSAVRTRTPVISILTRLRDSLAKDPIPTYTALLEKNPIDADIQNLQNERCERQIQALKEVLAFCKKENVNHTALWESQRQRTIQWCYYFRMPTEFRLDMK
jgi:23S rRNA U2552 (ribose-2'-O)-methylase RlmE/FtsJ